MRLWEVAGPDGKTVAGGIGARDAAAVVAVELYKARLATLIADNTAAGHPISELFGTDLGRCCSTGTQCHCDALVEAVNKSVTGPAEAC